VITIVLSAVAAIVVPIAALLALAVSERGSADRVRRRQEAPPLAHELPWWQITSDGTIVGVDLAYSTGLAVEGIDTDCLSDADLDHVQRALHSLLHPLPAGTILQWIFVTDQDHDALLRGFSAHATSETGCAELVSAQKVAAIRTARSLRRSRLYLFASLPNPFQSRLSRLGGPKLFELVSEDQHADQCRRLENLGHELRSALIAADLSARPLGGHEVRGLLYELLNPARARRVPVPGSPGGSPYQEPRTAREQLAFASAREDIDTLELDGRLLRVITLRDLPTATDPALLEGLTVGLPFSCRVQLAVELLDDQKALDELKVRRNRANAHAALGQRRNQEAEAAAADVEDLIDKNLAASIRMVKVGLSVVLSVDAAAPNARGTLDHQTGEVLRTLAGIHGAQGLIESYAQLDSFLGSLPANAHHRTRWHLCTSENAAHMLLAYQSWPGHGSPALLLENGRNYLVGLDPFAGELDNPNAFMAGASGAGKSVTTNYLLAHLFGAGVRGLIIDVGGSYRKLLSLYGGQYISFETAADVALNFFYEPADLILPDGSLDPLRRRFMVAVLESLLAEHDRPKLSHEQIAVLDAAIRALYEGAAFAPVLSDLQAFLRQAEWPDPEDAAIARQLARGLARWTQGAYARLLDRPSTIRLTADFAAFDLKGLSEEVRAPVVLILSAIIWNLVTRNPGEKKIVVFDEVWSLLTNPAAAELLEELYRTSRKYRCAILSISQSVDDFTGSSIASALINNSATTYLLRHRAGHDVIAETFHLNDREKFVFEGLEMRRGEYSELLILAGRQHHFLARVTLTPLEYWIATTHPADQAYLKDLQEAHPHLSLLDQLQLCAARHPHGKADAAAKLPAAAA
jgi:type IV secretory pathway VirB4 component